MAGARLGMRDEPPLAQVDRLGTWVGLLVLLYLSMIAGGYVAVRCAA